jgi:hypothetical protein
VGHWWPRRWKRIEPTVSLFVEDTAKFACGIFALAICYGLLRALEVMGYASERIEFLETAHYYALAAILVMFMVDLVLKIAGSLFTGRE